MTATDEGYRVLLSGREADLRGRGELDAPGVYGADLHSYLSVYPALDGSGIVLDDDSQQGTVVTIDEALQVRDALTSVIEALGG